MKRLNTKQRNQDARYSAFHWDDEAVKLAKELRQLMDKEDAKDAARMAIQPASLT